MSNGNGYTIINRYALKSFILRLHGRFNNDIYTKLGYVINISNTKQIPLKRQLNTYQLKVYFLCELVITLLTKKIAVVLLMLY